MATVVKYNGGTESWYSCTKPTQLEVGKEYEVLSVKDLGWQTNYTLKGINGEFNSTWFEKVNQPELYMALAKTLPTIGQNYTCYRIEFVEGQPKLISCHTSSVKGIQKLGNNMYKVSTKNNVYIVQVDINDD